MWLGNLLDLILSFRLLCIGKGSKVGKDMIHIVANTIISKTMLTIVLLMTCVCSLLSCSKQDDNKTTNEIVMTPGMIIKATNANGAITIEANQGTERTYKWNSEGVSVKLRKRDKRWNGSFGIYNPGGVGNIHTVVEEGQQHFSSEKEAIEWLSWQEKTMHYVYSSNGLVVGWYVTKDANSPLMALSVQVWQFYIQGQKPSQLSGACDDLVAVNYKGGEYPSGNIKVGDFKPSSPITINNRSYSGKSVDMIHEKGIKPENVENCISKGNSEKQGAYIYYYNITNNQPLWTMLDNDGRVVLVGN
jgi:hypothetical protein